MVFVGAVGIFNLIFGTNYVLKTNGGGPGPSGFPPPENWVDNIELVIGGILLQKVPSAIRYLIAKLRAYWFQDDPGKKR